MPGTYMGVHNANPLLVQIREHQRDFLDRLSFHNSEDIKFHVDHKSYQNLDSYQANVSKTKI